MAAKYDVDLLIIGGGCAGLSLGRILARYQSDLRVLIIEPRVSYQNDRTWCFWQGHEHRYRHLISHSWDQWRFSTASDACIQSGNGISYQYLRSSDFYDDAVDSIHASGNVQLVCGSKVKTIESRGSITNVSTSSGSVRTRYVVDTRPQTNPHVTAGSLQQVFLGAEVIADRAIFNPRVAGLMEDMTSDKNGFRFTYVLPFDERHALIEETRFTRDTMTPEMLATGLHRSLGNIGATLEIIRKETGSLPMTTHTKRRSDNPNIAIAGVAGGAVRASTGYAFQRIQKWAGDCAATLAAGGPPCGHAAEPLWRSAVDRLFLRVLRAQPEVGPSLFMAMGKRLSAQQLVRFLSDESRPSDFAKVARALPKTPFLRRLVASDT